MHPPILGTALVHCSPSLALVKYWGKQDTHRNLPATPSIAITLKELHTETRVWWVDADPKVTLGDEVVVGASPQDLKAFTPILEHFHRITEGRGRFVAHSANSFPTAAGLASSSSGMAALVCALDRATGARMGSDELSALARRGSASAARPIHGGFTLLDAGAESARPLHPESHWPELRVVVVSLRQGPKDTPSRGGMEQSRLTSPFYESWVTDSKVLAPRAAEALAHRDLNALGPLIRLSYLRMFATMFSADPPLMYWQPESVGVQQLCHRLRKDGVPAWETMDAGPQVKIFTLAAHADAVAEAVRTAYPSAGVLVDQAGPGPRFPEKPDLLDPLVLAGVERDFGTGHARGSQA